LLHSLIAAMTDDLPSEEMPRIPRWILPDGTYHVSTRGVARMPIYLDVDDHRQFLGLLRNVVDRFEWSCHAFCLMPNHYHLLVETTRKQLSRGMQRLNGVYAQGFNAKYGRWGHVFGDRFLSRVVESEEYLAALCAYVIENPVRAGLCAVGGDWPWSASRYKSSAASSVISFTPASACETGQFAFAVSAASPKAAASRPGTRPRTVKRLAVMPVPGTKVTVAEVESCSGGVPACPSAWESAIEKHAACAAAMSSSGLVRPDGSSAREAHVTSRGPNAPLPTRSIVPLPLIRSPCHVTSARRSVAIVIPLARREAVSLEGANVQTSS